VEEASRKRRGKKNERAFFHSNLNGPKEQFGSISRYREEKKKMKG